MIRYHYVITVQHAGRDFRLATHHGIYEDPGGGTEEQRYDHICRTIQEREGTTGPLATLFYQCVPGIAALPLQPGEPICVGCSKFVARFDEQWQQVEAGVLCAKCYGTWCESGEAGERIAEAIRHRQARERGRDPGGIIL